MTQTVVNIDAAGRLGTRIYSSLADAGEAVIGRYICVDDGLTVRYYVGVYGSPVNVWDDLKGSTGSAGPAGPVGPAGPTGPMGLPGVSDLNPPTLPSPGDAAISWTVIVPYTGMNLPYRFPAGYIINASQIGGIWTSDYGTGKYLTDWQGTASFTPNSIYGGRLVFLEVEADVVTGEQTAFYGPFDGLTTYTTQYDNSIVRLQANGDYTESGDGLILVNVTVTPPVGDVFMSYKRGSGPSYCNYGDTITIASPAPASCGPWDYGETWVVFNRQVKVTVINTDTWRSSGCDPSNTLWGYSTTTPISGSDPNALPVIHYPVFSDPTGSVVDPCVEMYTCPMGVSGPASYNVQLKIEAV